MSNRVSLFYHWPLFVALGSGILVVMALVQALSISAQSDSVIISKTASTDIVYHNEILTYTIIFTNTGAVSATVVMTDYIPSGTEYISGTVTGGATYVEEPPLHVRWEGTLLPEQSVTVAFQVRATAFPEPYPIPIVNEACIDGVCSEQVWVYMIMSRAWLPLVMRNWHSVPEYPWLVR